MTRSSALLWAANIATAAAIALMLWHAWDRPDPRHITPVEVLSKEQHDV